MAMTEAIREDGLKAIISRCKTLHKNLVKVSNNVADMDTEIQCIQSTAETLLREDKRPD